MRAFRVPFVGCRVHKIGYGSNGRVYLAPHRQDRVEIWHVHSLIPDSWQCLCDWPIEGHLAYSFFSLSKDKRRVGVLLVALVDDDLVRVSFIEVNIDTGFNAVNIDTGINAVNIDTGFNKVNIDTGFNKVNIDTRFNEVNIDTGFNAVDIDPGFKEVNIDTGFNKVKNDTGINEIDINTGFNAVNIDTGINAVNIDTGFNAINIDTGFNKVNIDTGNVQCWQLDEKAFYEFDKIFLDSIALEACSRGWFIYDRCVVMGSIPFWRIQLNEHTFTIQSDPIPGEESRCSRFPVMLDGSERLVARLNDDNNLMVFVDNKQWLTYRQPPSTAIPLERVSARGVRETYGKAGRRVAATCSKLSLLVGDSIVYAKIYRDERHEFYQLQLDHSTRTFSLILCAIAKIPPLVQQMCYPMVCGRLEVAFVTNKCILFVSTQPPTLRLSAFWSVQRALCHRDAHGAMIWTGRGLPEQAVKDLCAYKANKSLI